MRWLFISGWVGCVAVMAVACGDSASPGADETSGAVETGGSGSSGAADTADTSSSDAGSGTCAVEDDTGDQVEETHVVLLDDCELQLSCDPIHFGIESGLGECAVDLWANGQPGLLRIDYDEGFEEALLVMADRRVVRQRRGHVTATPGECGAPPWAPWGPHEVCDVSGELDPEGGVHDCEEVPDFTCAELVELYEADPLPPVPCDTRPQAECEGPLDADTSCIWVPQYATYPADSCAPAGEVGRCVELPPGPPPECVLPPLCDGVEEEAVIFRENDDGTVDITTIYGCWLYEGFDRCAWNAAGELVDGPLACECACG